MKNDIRKKPENIPTLYYSTKQHVLTLHCHQDLSWRNSDVFSEDALHPL